ncbi:MAG: hypothetical protein Q9170_003831 [Blastenia crenularia]
MSDEFLSSSETIFSPAEEDRLQWQRRLNLVYNSNGIDFGGNKPEEGPTAATPVIEEPDEQAYEFRLFSARSGKFYDSGHQPPKVQIASPEPLSGEPGFVRPRRFDDYYFAGHDEVKRKRYELVAVEGEDVVKEASMKRVSALGFEVPWRVISITNKISKPPTEKLAKTQGEAGGKRKRKGKKTRIAIRLKTQAQRVKEEMSKQTEARKEEMEREKRRRKNRGRTVKRREQARATKKEKEAEVSAEPLTAFVSVCDHNASAGGIHLCCDGGRTLGSCCKNTTEVFTLAAPFSSITAGPASATDTAATTSATSGTSDSAVTITSSSTSTSTPVLQSPIAQNPTPQAPTAEPTPRVNHDKIVGAAVGGGLGGGLILGTLALLAWLRRRRNKKKPTTKIHISLPLELPSNDPTFRSNSMLFPAELQHQASESSLVPAELENKGSDATTSTGATELSATTEEQAAGPFELHGKEIDLITEPPSPIPFDENRRSPFTRAEQTGSPATNEPSSIPDGHGEEAEVGPRRPSLRHRPGSISGPWHDSY